MGADLYITSRYQALQDRYQADCEAAVTRRNRARTSGEHERAQAEVNRLFSAMHPEGAYHRDAYNSFSLVAQLGLSWWRDVAPRLEDDDSLPLVDVQWLLDEVCSRRLSCQVEPTEEQAMAAEVIAELGGSRSTSTKVETLESYSAEDVQWFVSRKAALIQFLETALELGEKPVCSL